MLDATAKAHSTNSRRLRALTRGSIITGTMKTYAMQKTRSPPSARLRSCQDWSAWTTATNESARNTSQMPLPRRQRALRGWKKTRSASDRPLPSYSSSQSADRANGLGNRTPRTVAARTSGRPQVVGEVAPRRDPDPDQRPGREHEPAADPRPVVGERSARDLGDPVRGHGVGEGADPARRAVVDREPDPAEHRHQHDHAAVHRLRCVAARQVPEADTHSRHGQQGEPAEADDLGPLDAGQVDVARQPAGGAGREEGRQGGEHAGGELAEDVAVRGQRSQAELPVPAGVAFDGDAGADAED